MLNGKKLKERIKRGEVVTSIMLRLPDPNIAEMLAIQGVDLIIIDNEHYPFDPETMIEVIRAAHAGGAACMVRLPNVEQARIAQVMDMGSDGIQIPSVSSYEEAMELVDALKFAPEGHRGFCPITRAACYGNGMTPAEFAQLSNENSFTVPQIETKEGVEDIDRILSIPQVDWVPIGPSDLSASYGCPGDYGNPKVINAIRLVREKAKAVNKVGWEMYHSPETMAEARNRGERFLSLGSDQQILMNGLKSLVGAVRHWQDEQRG
ncbi:MAG: aldolase/citrate lyase family protein [Lawsonibacter sp.]